MRSDWFIITCTVDNGNTIGRYETFVNALTLSEAKFQAMKFWETQSSGQNTVVKIEDYRRLRPSEIVIKKVA
jgi:hypothetical protein